VGRWRGTAIAGIIWGFKVEVKIATSAGPIENDVRGVNHADSVLSARQTSAGGGNYGRNTNCGRK